jgi:hypothetical protein
MCQRLLGYDLDKDSIDHKEWGRKTLTEAQLQYAALDVIALKLLHDVLTQESVSPVSEDSSIHLSEEAESIYAEPRRVKLDPVHWFMRLRIPKSNPFYSTFLRRMRDAVFIHSTADREKAAEVIRDVHDMDFEVFYDRNPRWVHERVRRSVPAPAELDARIKEVLDEFKQDKYKDPSNGLPLLSTTELDRIERNLMTHVRNGCLSDVPGESLYFKHGQDSNGLNLFRCIRGSNCLEGGLHKNLSKKVSCVGASLKYADLFINYFIYRYNRDASVRNRIGEEDYGHYDLDVCAKVNALAKLLGHEEYISLSGYSNCQAKLLELCLFLAL